LEKIKDAWLKKTLIRQRLAARMDAIGQMALLNAELVKQIIES
jgi:hypothetical protein